MRGLGASGQRDNAPGALGFRAARGRGMTWRWRAQPLPTRCPASGATGLRTDEGACFPGPFTPPAARSA